MNIDWSEAPKGCSYWGVNRIGDAWWGSRPMRLVGNYLEIFEGDSQTLFVYQAPLFDGKPGDIASEWDHVTHEAGPKMPEEEIFNLLGDDSL